MLQTDLPHDQYFYLSLHKTLLHMVLWAVLLPQLREKLVLIGHGVPTTLLCAAIWAGEHISGWEEANKEDTHQRFCIFFHSFKGPNYSLRWWSCFRLLLPWAPIINFAFMRSISALPLSLSVHINHMQYHKNQVFLKLLSCCNHSTSTSRLLLVNKSLASLTWTEMKLDLKPYFAWRNS